MTDETDNTAMGPTKKEKRSARDQKAYEHCRDNLFPLLSRLNAKAEANLAERRKAEQDAKK